MSLPRRVFRPARPASGIRNLAKTGGQIVVVWTFALVLLPALIAAAEKRAGARQLQWRRRRRAGAVLLGAGSGLGLASAWLMAVQGEGTPVPFDAARRLVVAGPYRVVRNPMALSAVVQIAGVAAWLGSPGTAVLAVASGVGWNAVFRPGEEAFLIAQFGVEYERYRDAVRCWVPRWPPYTLS